MKRFFSCFIVIAFIISLATSAYAFAFDFSGYTDEELIELETALQKEKIDRGIAKSANVPAGTYIVGKDIPAGDYSVSINPTGVVAMAMITVTPEKGYSDSYIIQNGTDIIGKMTIHDGDTLETITPIILTVYSGGISFN